MSCWSAQALDVIKQGIVHKTESVLWALMVKRPCVRHRLQPHVLLPSLRGRRRRSKQQQLTERAWRALGTSEHKRRRLPMRGYMLEGGRASLGRADDLHSVQMLAGRRQSEGEGGGERGQAFGPDG